MSQKRWPLWLGIWWDEEKSRTDVRMWHGVFLQHKNDGRLHVRLLDSVVLLKDYGKDRVAVTVEQISTEEFPEIILTDAYIHAPWYVPHHRGFHTTTDQLIGQTPPRLEKMATTAARQAVRHRPRKQQVLA